MRPMRRKDRAMPEDEARALLERGEYGVLATAGAGGLPLATPLSYVMLNGSLYFHCAQTGHKLDNLALNPKVCFAVVDGVRPVFDRDFTTLYQSVLVHGTAALVEDDDEKRRALWALAEKYLPAHMDKADASIGAGLAHTAVVRITPQGISGKARRPAGGGA